MALDPDQVQKPIRKLRKVLKLRWNGKQISSEDVHDLRTNTRRVEASLAALALDSKRNGRRVLKDLGRVRKRAGKVRDMDVLTGFAATLNDDGEQECKVQLLEHLGAKRRKGAKQLYSVIADNGGGLRRELRRLSGDLDSLLCQDGSKGCDPQDAAAQAAAAALRLESDLADTGRLGRQNLHPYRLKVKELRNVLRMAKDSGDKEFVETLGAVKDGIGEWHDWEELSAIAQRVLRHGPACSLIRRVKRISEEKYAAALRSAEQMRKQYLGAAQGKKTPGVRRPSKPVWTATSAMAA